MFLSVKKLKCHKKQQEATGTLQGRNRHVEVVKNRLATDCEDRDDEKGGGNGHVRRLVTFLFCETLCDGKENRRITRRVEDDEHRDDYFTEKVHTLRVREQTCGCNRID